MMKHGGQLFYNLVYLFVEVMKHVVYDKINVDTIRLNCHHRDK